MNSSYLEIHRLQIVIWITMMLPCLLQYLKWEDSRIYVVLIYPVCVLILCDSKTIQFHYEDVLLYSNPSQIVVKHYQLSKNEEVRTVRVQPVIDQQSLTRISCRSCYQEVGTRYECDIDNRIKTKGFVFLVNLMRDKKYPQLWELDVSSRDSEKELWIENELDASCISALEKVIEATPRVTNLHVVNLDGNGISEDVLDDFKQKL